MHLVEERMSPADLMPVDSCEGCQRKDGDSHCVRFPTPVVGSAEVAQSAARAGHRACSADVNGQERLIVREVLLRERQRHSS